MSFRVFGRAISGMDVIHKIEELRVDRKDRVGDNPLATPALTKSK